MTDIKDESNTKLPDKQLTDKEKQIVILISKAIVKKTLQDFDEKKNLQKPQ